MYQQTLREISAPANVSRHASQGVPPFLALKVLPPTLTPDRFPPSEPISS